MSQGSLNYWLYDAGDVGGEFAELSLYEMLITNFKKMALCFGIARNDSSMNSLK